MKTSRAPIAIVLVLTMVCTTVLTGCGRIVSKAPQSPYDYACKTALGINVALDTVQDANEFIFLKLHLVTDKESIAIAKGILHSSQVNDKFIANLKTLGAVDPQNIPQISAWLGNLALDLKDLNDRQLLGVKDADARNRLSIAFATVTTATDALAAILNMHILWNGNQGDPQVTPVTAKISITEGDTDGSSNGNRVDLEQRAVSDFHHGAHRRAEVEVRTYRRADPRSGRAKRLRSPGSGAGVDRQAELRPGFGLKTSGFGQGDFAFIRPVTLQG